MTTCCSSAQYCTASGDCSLLPINHDNNWCTDRSVPHMLSMITDNALPRRWVYSSPATHDRELRDDVRCLLLCMRLHLANQPQEGHACRCQSSAAQSFNQLCLSGTPVPLHQIYVRFRLSPSDCRTDFPGAWKLHQEPRRYSEATADLPDAELSSGLHVDRKRSVSTILHPRMVSTHATG